MEEEYYEDDFYEGEPVSDTEGSSDEGENMSDAEEGFVRGYEETAENDEMGRDEDDEKKMGDS